MLSLVVFLVRDAQVCFSCFALLCIALQCCALLGCAFLCVVYPGFALPCCVLFCLGVFCFWFVFFYFAVLGVFLSVSFRNIFVRDSRSPRTRSAFKSPRRSRLWRRSSQPSRTSVSAHTVPPSWTHNRPLPMADYNRTLETTTARWKWLRTAQTTTIDMRHQPTH